VLETVPEGSPRPLAPGELLVVIEVLRQGGGAAEKKGRERTWYQARHIKTLWR